MIVTLDTGLFTRDCLKFCVQVGHGTMYASIGKKHFSLSNVIVRLTKIMNKLGKDHKIQVFSHFAAYEIGRTFKKNLQRIFD